MNMKYTLKETISLLKSRIKASRESYKEYKKLYEESCRVYDIEQAEKYHRWMMQEYHTLTELNYLYDTITGKGE